MQSWRVPKGPAPHLKPAWMVRSPKPDPVATSQTPGTPCLGTPCLGTPIFEPLLANLGVVRFFFFSNENDIFSFSVSKITQFG